MTDFDEKKYLTVKKAALAYRVSQSTIRRMIKAGQLKHIKVGGEYLIEPLPEPELPETETPEPIERDFYTTFEVANIFEVERKTIERWIHRGEIQAEKVSGEWRIKKSYIAELHDKMMADWESKQNKPAKGT
jgi:excisionase family DNA binding protein